MHGKVDIVTFICMLYSLTGLFCSPSLFLFYSQQSASKIHSLLAFKVCKQKIQFTTKIMYFIYRRVRCLRVRSTTNCHFSSFCSITLVHRHLLSLLETDCMQSTVKELVINLSCVFVLFSS